MSVPFIAWPRGTRVWHVSREYSKDDWCAQCNSGTGDRAVRWNLLRVYVLERVCGKTLEVYQYVD